MMTIINISWKSYIQGEGESEKDNDLDSFPQLNSCYKDFVYTNDLLSTLLHT